MITPSPLPFEAIAELICAECRGNARRNETLGISFCPIHGFQSVLIPTDRELRWR